MTPKFIRKLIDTFQIEIIRSEKPLKWENTFDLDINNNVRSLYLDEIKIHDLTIFDPIANHLTELSVTRAGIENLGIIKSFPQLEFLDLSFNPIQTGTLSNLCDLKNLKRLYLEGTNITDTSALGGINSLESLYLGGSDVLDRINGLEGLKNLIQLEISLTKIRDFENVHVSDSIRFLSAKSTVDKISGLDRFQNLEELYLMSNYFEKIEGLDQLKFLKRLNLFDSGISKIEGLDNLTNLEILDLGANEITEIKGLSNLTKLKKLSIGFNKLSKVNNLDELSQLEYLLLDGNYITEFDLTFLTKLTQDCTVSLCNNPIKSIDGFIPDNVKVEFESVYSVYRTLF